MSLKARLKLLSVIDAPYVSLTMTEFRSLMAIVLAADTVDGVIAKFGYRPSDVVDSVQAMHDALVKLK